MRFCLSEIHITGRPKVIWLFYYLGYCSLDMDNRIKSRPPVIANIRNRFWPKLIHFWPKLGCASNPNLTFISFRSIMAFDCPIFSRTWSVFHSMDNQSWQFSRTICPSVPTEFAEDHDDALWVMIDWNRATCLVTLILIYFSENRITILFQITGSSLFVYIIIFWFISSNNFCVFRLPWLGCKPTQNRFFLVQPLTVTISEKFQNFHLQAEIVISEGKSQKW